MRLIGPRANLLSRHSFFSNADRCLFFFVRGRCAFLCGTHRLLVTFPGHSCLTSLQRISLCTRLLLETCSPSCCISAPFVRLAFRFVSICFISCDGSDTLAVALLRSQISEDFNSCLSSMVRQSRRRAQLFRPIFPRFVSFSRIFPRRSSSFGRFLAPIEFQNLKCSRITALPPCLLPRLPISLGEAPPS